ncbi:hypothetical protein B0A52_06856 [Exophiala mesophila]|uniref:DNA-directed RNA polymerase III subunit n=1 Tax=Exophiala mesophila TaxID=212818 RepID=A0A438N0R0_EXOME|nr:hypothetical protein B0A52_06856 [Exophiala mesophila]
MPPKRGGRGGKRGPDLSWEDADENAPKDAELSKKMPGPRFPPIKLKVPRPIDASERASVNAYLQFRDLARKGPYFAILDPSHLTDAKTGKVHSRLGFDPFNDQEKYTAKFHRRKRTVPDLSTRDYELRTFPQELWPGLDPKQKNPIWKTVDAAAIMARSHRLLKRKREALPAADDDEEEKEADGNETDESDPLLMGSRRARNATKAAKQRRDDSTTKKSKEKKGLDAEDDYGDDDARDNDDDDEDGEEGAEAEEQDSEFDESDDADGDDYNAEQYFDTGEGDEDDFGGDDDGGTY